MNERKGPGSFEKTSNSRLPSQREAEDNVLARNKERLHLLERKIQLQEGLPFLYGWKWYPWARAFYDNCTDKVQLLCAANQISKSSTQIRKAINWATNEALWKTLWPNHKPKQFWYLYPTSKQTQAEWETKWILFLPAGKYKDEEYLDFEDGLGKRKNPYHWKEIKYQKELFGIKFINTGIFLYFKTYAQDTQALQTGTVDALFCDEELPIEHYDELNFRVTATNGYFHMVFTATLGQEFWRLAMEPEEHETETLPKAHKQTISMFECQRFEDGTPSHWTDERIKEVIERCQSEEEVMKRVYGRFIMDRKGRTYPTFDIKKHMRPDHPLPSGWLVYSGVDIGSGGNAHKAAIVFVAVSPDFKKGRVFLGWRGEKDKHTTAGDVYDQHCKMKAERGLNPVMQSYDWQSKDFFVIASRAGEGFQKAEKDHARGEENLNTLFKNNMLMIYDTPELQKLARELSTLRKETSKTKAKDDFCDALRYAVTPIPWQWTKDPGNVAEIQTKPQTPMEAEIAERRSAFIANKKEEERIESEIAEFNEACGD